MMKLMGYAGKTVVITGAASGMGKATAELLVQAGAVVYAMDVKPVEVEGIKAFIPVDLSKKESIDEAFKLVPDAVDCFMGIAGLRGATLDFMTVANINLIANKYILEEVLIDRLVSGGSVALVSSAAGIGWEKDGNTKFYRAVVEAEGYEATVAALKATGLTGINRGFAYPYTKLAVNLLVAKLQKVYGPKGVRVNVLLPGDTATGFGGEDGLAKENDRERLSPYTGHAGRVAESKEMAWPLLFLCSDLASYVSGAMMPVDFGACAEIMAGYRQNPCGVSIEDNFAKARG